MLACKTKQGHANLLFIKQMYIQNIIVYNSEHFFIVS